MNAGEMDERGMLPKYVRMGYVVGRNRTKIRSTVVDECKKK